MAKEPGKTRYRAKVSLLSLWAEFTQLHIINHALSKRADRIGIHDKAPLHSNGQMPTCSSAQSGSYDRDVRVGSK